MCVVVLDRHSIEQLPSLRNMDKSAAKYRIRSCSLKRGTVNGDMEGCGPSQPLVDRWQTVSRLRRSVALQEIGKRWQPAVATMIDGDLEG
jgi:hypothetical protein